ncbi:MAG: hypothetical protein ABIA97_06900, partial [Candidatus Omnitrophota bacterium]
FVMAMLVSGCATVPNMGAVSLGMTKGEVIKVLGKPFSVSGQGNTEYLTYNDRSGIYGDFTVPYFVRLIDGKVESYGKAGDFDSTKNPTNNLNVNVTGFGK